MQRLALGVVTALVLTGCGSGTKPVVAPPTLPRRHVHGPARVGGRHDGPVPILVYHALGAQPLNAPFPRLWVSRAEFVAQVRWLAAHGYHAVTLHRVWDYWHDARPLPRRPVVLTFDDGYPGDVEIAMPALRRERWGGNLNLQLGNLVPKRVRELIRAGWEIDAHTFTHPDLTLVDPARLRREIAGSRAAIRHEFGVPADFFTYPSGRYDPAVEAAVQRAGYLGAMSENPGLARPADLWHLDRIRVNGGESLAAFAAALSSRS